MKHRAIITEHVNRMRALPHSCLLILLVSLSVQIKVVAYKSAKEGETRETSIGIRGLKREVRMYQRRCTAH